MNHRYGIFFSLLLAAVLSFGTFPVRLAAEDSVHVVAKGETLYSISRSYQVSPEELMKYNDISDASKLQIGRRLRIPPSFFPVPSASTASSTAAPAKSPPAPAAAAAPATAQTAYTEYTVVKNDTLYSIARSRGVSLQTLLDINRFSQNHVLKAGERIKIPAAGGTAGTASSGTNVRPAAAPAGSGQNAVRQTASKTVDASLRWPVKPKEIAYMTGKLYGVVVQGERSEPVKSLTQGTVISAGPYRGFGRVAIVQVSGGYLYVYGGCESLTVKEGDRIGPGTELGKLGIDAVSGKPQLFFMVYRSNTPIDPAKAPRA